jgi:hypothetical protein
LDESTQWGAGVSDGIEPIADDELLYRRVPASMPWYDVVTQELRPEAFQPHKQRDVTGISLWRGKLKSMPEAAKGQPGKSYYLALLRAGDVRRAGMIVAPRPDLPGGYDPAHAELPELNASNYKDTVTLERQRILVSLCRSVEGPFETPRS